MQQSNRSLANLEDAIKANKLAETSAALNHLYSSIAQLEPVTDRIDAKIQHRVISGMGNPHGGERNRHFSA